MRVNFDGVESQQGGGLIPEDKYRVVVEQAEERTASTGTEGIALTLVISGGDYDGRVLWDNLWLTPAAMGMVKYRLECLGATIPDGEGELDPRDLVGRQAYVTVKHEEYDGKPRARISAWDAVPGHSAAGSGASTRDSSIPFDMSRV